MALDIPTDLSVQVQKFNLVREIDLFTLPDFQELIEYQKDTIVQFFLLNVYEISYQAEYTINGKNCSLNANTFLILPKQLIDNPQEVVPLTFISGSVNGMDAFLPEEYFENRKKFLSKSIEALGVFFHAYYFQMPVHIICKRGPEINLKFSGAYKEQNIFGRQWTSDYCAKCASNEVLEKLKIPTSKEKYFVGGISNGGFRTLLLSTFDETVTHSFSVAGVFSFKLWLDKNGECISPFYGPIDLLSKNIDTSDIFSLSKTKMMSLFAMSDGGIQPYNFKVLKQTNQKRLKYGLDPIQLHVFHLEPNRRGHSWPRIEAMNFFGNAIFESTDSNTE